MIIITLQITTIVTKKHHSSSDESIENLLYYKDCKHKQKDLPTEPPPRPELLVERKPECPCPRMCCSMCCDCGDSQSFLGRQNMPMQSNMIEPMQSPMLMAAQPREPSRSPMQQQLLQRGRKRKMKPKGMDSPLLQPPIGGRRAFGFTRENIKNLISQDEDIKKILKDLVRVTIKKVDLVDMVKKSKEGEESVSEKNLEVPISNNSEDDEDE